MCVCVCAFVCVCVFVFVFVCNVWIHRECGQDSGDMSDAVAQGHVSIDARDRWWEKDDDEGRQIEKEGLRDDFPRTRKEVITQMMTEETFFVSAPPEDAGTDSGSWPFL